MTATVTARHRRGFPIDDLRGVARRAMRASSGGFAAVWVVIAMMQGMLGASPAAAQGNPVPPPSFERPAERWPSEPLPTPGEGRADDFVLPPVPEPSPDETRGDRATGAIWVRSVELRGNTAIDASTLLASIDAFLGRTLTVEGLEALRRRLTEVYVEAGFVNSGATIPPQSVEDGHLVVEIIEGRVSEVRFVGLEHYRASVLRDRILRGLGTPLDINEIEDQIRILDQDPRVAQINARLRPGDARSEAILEIAVRERPPWQLSLGFDNYESPSVGAYGGRFGISHANVFGLGDRLAANLSQTEGLTRIAARYAVPVHASGTSIFAEANLGWAALVENTFRRAEIESRDFTIGVGIAQNVWRSPADQIDLSLAFERRRSKTEAAGSGFSFGDGPQNGRSEVSVLRAVGEWTHRGLDSVLALRSMLSFGTDWFNPTTQPPGTPDGLFVSWYAQARAVHRLPDSGIEFRFRGDLQLADRPLLSLEQYAIGGAGSVRGYRRNQLVRDQGLSAALDVHFPIVRRNDAHTLVAFTPFVDFGYAWNEDRATDGLRTLSGVGFGVEFRPIRQLEFLFEYAHGFRNPGTSRDLQDESIYLRAVWRLF